MRGQGRRGLALLGPHPLVEAAAREELGVGAALDDAAAVHDDDAVGVHHGAESVGDHHSGGLALRAAEGRLDRPFGERVEVAGGLVEDQQARGAEQRAGHRDPLPLTAGQGALSF